MAYTKIKNFRFWCQKVLPTIYDDSLSYYEVLCKIRDLINDIITNMDSLAEAIEDLDNRLDAVEAKLNDLSQLIIDEVKRYIQSDEFVEQLIDELTSSQTFNNWFHDFITNNPDVIRDLINSEYFDEYFNDYITNNPDIVNSLLSNPNFISNFADAMARQTDFYDIANISDGDISKGGLVSNFYAIGKNSQIAAGTRLKVMYKPTVTPIVGKFERTSAGGFYHWASDGDNNYTSFIIDMNGFEGRNLYVKIDEAFDPYSYTFVKRGSLDTGGVSVTSDKGTPTGQAAYIPGDYLKLEPTKAVNFVLISIKNNGVAFNPTFTYSMRNVDFDSNTDTPVLIPFNAFEIWDGASDTAITNLELFKPNNELAYIIFGAIGSAQYGLSEDITSVDSQVSNLQEDMVELKNSVSDGKALVASAITDKGVATASDATFNTMASNILNIPTGNIQDFNGFLDGEYLDLDDLDLTTLGFTRVETATTLEAYRLNFIRAGLTVSEIYQGANEYIHNFDIIPQISNIDPLCKYYVSNGGFYLQWKATSATSGSSTEGLSFGTYPAVYVKQLSNGGLIMGNPYNETVNNGVIGFTIFNTSTAFDSLVNDGDYYATGQIKNELAASSVRIRNSKSMSAARNNNIAIYSPYINVYTDNNRICIQKAISDKTYGTAYQYLNSLFLSLVSKANVNDSNLLGMFFRDENNNYFWLPKLYNNQNVALLLN